MINKELYTSEISIKIFRCPNFYEIPYITPHYVENQIIIGYNYSNNHFGDKDIYLNLIQKVQILQFLL